jgi:hypothetical protein
MTAIHRGFLAVASFLLVQETSAFAEPSHVDWSLGNINDITELDLGDLLKTPVVESAARRKQSLDEAPGALEVFESDEIVTAGFQAYSSPRSTPTASMSACAACMRWPTIASSSW